MPKMSSDSAAPCQRTTLHGPTMGTRWSASVDADKAMDLAALRQDLAAAVEPGDALAVAGGQPQMMDARPFAEHLPNASK